MSRYRYRFLPALAREVCTRQITFIFMSHARNRPQSCGLKTFEAALRGPGHQIRSATYVRREGQREGEGERGVREKEREMERERKRERARERRRGRERERERERDIYIYIYI